MSGYDALRKPIATKTKKSSTPVINAPNDSVSDMIGEFVEASRKIKESEAIVSEISGRLKPILSEMRIEHCHKEKKIVPSISVKSKDNVAVMLTQSDAYLQMGEEHQETLQKEFGDKFDKLFHVKETFSFSSDDFTPEVMKKIVELIGDDATEKLANSRKVVISPTEEFSFLSIFDRDIEVKTNKMQELGLCQLKSPGLKPV